MKFICPSCGGKELIRSKVSMVIQQDVIIEDNPDKHPVNCITYSKEKYYDALDSYIIFECNYCGRGLPGDGSDESLVEHLTKRSGASYRTEE